MKQISAIAGIFTISVIAVLIFFKTAHASFFHIVDSILGGQQASASVNIPDSEFNSQNLGLQAYAASDPTPILADDTVPIDVSGQILLPDIASNNTGSTDSGSLQISRYTVQEDDTLSGIANMFDITVDTIKQANGLKSNTVRTGQTLIILPISGILYTVESGDTIQSIANKTKSDINDILVYNGLTKSVIERGQKLVIPHGKPSASDIKSFLSSQKIRVPSFEPILDPVWNWPSYPGYFSCPVPGARLSQGLHGHNAVDLAVAVGTPIHAAAAGIILVSKSNGMWNGGYGNFVMISHPNGVQTLYAHMSRTAVKAGQHVYQGQIIGFIGMTGLTTGPHTHFEIRGAQNPFVDPALCR